MRAWQLRITLALLAALVLGLGFTSWHTRSTGRVNMVDGSALIRIPSGSFVMGSNDGEADERPVHTVTLPSYWIGRTKVNNEQFARFLNACGLKEDRGVPWLDLVHSPGIERADGSFRSRKGQESAPVGGVTFRGAVAYCNWAHLRLPTEAEWEKAARGTDGRKYPWGNQWDPACANGLPSPGKMDDDELAVALEPSITAPAEHTKGASPYGCLDMVGNLWEWCGSVYSLYPYDPRDGRENPTSDGPRVIRGGAWYLGPEYLRAANRYRKFPELYEAPMFPAANGFRVACDDAPAAPSTAASGTLRAPAHPPYVPLRPLSQTIAPDPANDLKYRVSVQALAGPGNPIVGYPATLQRETQYFVPKERLLELLLPGRDTVVSPSIVIEALHLGSGAVVADIGAGSGFFTYRLAQTVGPKGSVWATDISLSSLHFLQARVQTQPLSNVHLVLHDVTDCLLPSGTLDAALVSDTQYFYYPRARSGASPQLAQVIGFYASIARALKPHGRLGILENTGHNSEQLNKRGDLTVDDIVAQMRAAGLRIVGRKHFDISGPHGVLSQDLLVFQPLIRAPQGR